jgi:hypothetical protein
MTSTKGCRRFGDLGFGKTSSSEPRRPAKAWNGASCLPAAAREALEKWRTRELREAVEPGRIAIHPSGRAENLGASRRRKSSSQQGFR